MNHIKDNDQIEAAQVMRMVLKIFWSATMYALPQAQGVDVNGWFQIIGHILQKNLPENAEGIAPHGQPLDKDERRAWPWWKLKKWAAKILSHFIQRYGNPRYAATENEKFAEFFKNTIATPLLGPVMNTLALKTQEKFVTDEVHRYCLAYLASAVELSVTYKAVKPHLDFVLFQVIFPTLCLSAEEVALFTDDPVEFVRKVHDPTEVSKRTSTRVYEGTHTPHCTAKKLKLYSKHFYRSYTNHRALHHSITHRS
jgi:importin-7